MPNTPMRHPRKPTPFAQTTWKRGELRRKPFRLGIPWYFTLTVPGDEETHPTFANYLLVIDFGDDGQPLRWAVGHTGGDPRTLADYDGAPFWQPDVFVPPEVIASALASGEPDPMSLQPIWELAQYKFTGWLVTLVEGFGRKRGVQ